MDGFDSYGEWSQQQPKLERDLLSFEFYISLSGHISYSPISISPGTKRRRRGGDDNNDDRMYDNNDDEDDDGGEGATATFFRVAYLVFE